MPSRMVYAVTRGTLAVTRGTLAARFSSPRRMVWTPRQSFSSDRRPTNPRPVMYNAPVTDYVKKWFREEVRPELRRNPELARQKFDTNLNATLTRFISNFNKAESSRIGKGAGILDLTTMIGASSRMIDCATPEEHPLKDLGDLKGMNDAVLSCLETIPGGMLFARDLRRELKPLIFNTRRRLKKKSTMAFDGNTEWFDNLREFERALWKKCIEDWFSGSNMDLIRIESDAPPDIIDMISECERVHEIRDQDDLKQRLGYGRRCYALARSFENETKPLIGAFVWVALVNGGPVASIEDIISATPPADVEATCDTAMFYSISNVSGLGGLSLGKNLIQLAKEKIDEETQGRVRNVYTISPSHKFRKWLLENIKLGEVGKADATFANLLSRAEKETLVEFAETHNLGTNNPLDLLGYMVEEATLKTMSESFRNRESYDKESPIGMSIAILEPILKRLFEDYLKQTKVLKGETISKDKTAAFHIGNGARIGNIHFMADPGDVGIARSCGMMVNYIYNVEQEPAEVGAVERLRVKS